MQENIETARLHKKRSLSLSSLIRSRPLAGEMQKLQENMARSEQEMARKVRVQKAAAWQWYTRAVGEAVVSTKRPPVNGESPPSQSEGTTSARGKSFVNGSSSEGIATNSNVLQKVVLSGSPRVASRFKAESARVCGQLNSPGSQAPPPAPFAGPSTTPLYDEFELSRLRTHMADFVQHLQPPQQTTDNEKLPIQQPQLHVGIDGGGRPLPAAAGSADLQHTTAGPSTAAAAIAGLTKPIPSAAPFHMRPFFALYKLFHNVVSGRSIIKSSKKNSPLTNTNSTRAVYIEPGRDHFEREKTIPQYHYHHYIHHHHHHYHYNTESPDKRAIHSRRRYSESGDVRPHIPSPWDTEPIEEEVEEAEKRILFNDAYQLARRRRHSDTFAARLTPTRAAFDDQEEMQEGSAKAASPLKLPTRYNSQRISPSKCGPAILEYSKLYQLNAELGTDEEFLGIRKQEEFGTEKRSGGKSISGGNCWM